ncbi:MAG TPA: hypothetical protein VF920_17330 [Dongiaceae bacterium]
MLDIIPTENFISPMSQAALGKVRELEARAVQLPQENIETWHMFHAGMYARTVKIPAGVMITGALIKIATILIVSGDAIIYVDGGAKELHGYTVFSASANRKQVFVALTDTYLTMLFPTKSKTVEAAEAAFTDETGLLMSRRDISANTMTVTGE